MPARLRESDRSRGTSRPDTEKLARNEGRGSHKISRRKSSKKDQENTLEGASLSSPNKKKRHSMTEMPQTEKTVIDSGLESRSSVPYPTFSKAHSKEAVGSREGLRPSLNIFTPDPTDLDASKEKPVQCDPAKGQAPPSPPLTSVDQDERASRTSRPKQDETISAAEGKKKNQTSDKSVKIKLRPRSSNSKGYVRSVSNLSSPEKAPRSTQSPLKKKLEKERQTSSGQPSKIAPLRQPSVDHLEVETSASSNATSIAPHQPDVQRPGSRPPPVTVEDDENSELTPHNHPRTRRGQTPLSVLAEAGKSPASGIAHHPPPPPPPPLAPISPPKVDYLLQHGGLNQAVPKNLLLARKSTAPQQTASAQQRPIVANLFEPYSRLLDDYQHVMSMNGSLAVATGCRSVARRLLDRLEAVFARDISTETCQCDMCTALPDQNEEVHGFSWGEILELVSGRRDLPLWPPFSLAANPQGLGIVLESHVPMQKVDIDVPEELQGHYLRQSKKTKQRVDKWLLRQDDNSTSPPGEVDDETLSFAILTHLNPDQRVSYSNLLCIATMPSEEGTKRIPSPQRGPTPQPAPSAVPRRRCEPIVTAGYAIQRLYRLASAPRDPETALYLLNNPGLHHALATLAAISDDEWEILISGRFDGFLRSGAEDAVDANTPPSRQTPLRPVNSRGPTPLQGNGPNRLGSNPFRTSTPASGAHHGAPIAYDEETEMAALAEIERDIYSSMEALEDAFEGLHLKAEAVRGALRERGAGLASMQQRRRGGMGDGVEVRMGTPATNGGGGDSRWDLETDDGLGDWEGISELAPDDSASNISSSRRRRPKRRNERRTPALVEEEDEGAAEDEDLAESEGTASPRKR